MRFLIYLALSSGLAAIAASGANPAPVLATADNAGARISLVEALTDRNASGFARRLGEMLGVEVRLPEKGFRKLSVPAGDWTATQLLNHVAGQFEDVTWQPIYELRRRSGGRRGPTPPASKLPIRGKVTFTAVDVSYPQAVERVEEASASIIRLPHGIPPGRFRTAWKETPLDRVLSDLAAAGGLQVSQVVVFRRGDEALAEASRQQEERQTRETLQQAEIANRLQELYGVDAYGQEFPWDAIDREDVSASLGREFDLDPSLAGTLMERIRLEGLTRLTE